MTYALARREKVEILGFARFKVVPRPPRKAKKLKTGEIVDVSAKNYAHFQCGKELSRRINTKARPPDQK